MSLSCDVTRDLLPLYHDGVCSEESRALVEAHLKACPDCSAILAELRGEIDLPHEEPNDGAVLKKLHKNVKRAWIRGAAAVLAVVMLVLAGRYGWWYVHDYCANRFKNINYISFKTRKNNLSFRVTKSCIIFYNLNAILCGHKTKENNTFIYNTFIS